MTSVITRNREILKRILSGDSYEDCIKDYHFASYASVQNAICKALQSLKEHTDIEIRVSASHSHIMQHKNLILEHLEKPYPKTDLLYNARRILEKQFGKYYVTMPGGVAKHFDEIKQGLNPHQNRRELDSIKKWLSSEGYLVDDYIDDEMVDFAFNNLTSKIKDLNINENNYSFKVNEIITSKIQGHPARLLRVEISFGKHRVNKVISFEMS